MEKQLPPSLCRRATGRRRYEVVHGQSFSARQHLPAPRPSPSSARPAQLAVGRGHGKITPYAVAQSAAARSAPGSWVFGSAELQRKKRVARYKYFTVEAKLKDSFKKSLCWIKNACSTVTRR